MRPEQEDYKAGNYTFVFVMKRVLIFLCIISLLCTGLSCGKKEVTGDDPLPEWIPMKVSELITDQNLCQITDITVISYNGKTYYHIYCGIWSCMYCHLFDEEGNRPAWEQNEWNDFFARKKEIRKVPACRN